MQDAWTIVQRVGSSAIELAHVLLLLVAIGVCWIYVRHRPGCAPLVAGLGLQLLVMFISRAWSVFRPRGANAIEWVQVGGWLRVGTDLLSLCGAVLIAYGLWRLMRDFRALRAATMPSDA